MMKFDYYSNKDIIRDKKEFVTFLNKYVDILNSWNEHFHGIITVLKYKMGIL